MYWLILCVLFRSAVCNFVCWRCCHHGEIKFIYFVIYENEYGTLTGPLLWSYLAAFQVYCRFLCWWPHPYSSLILRMFSLDQIAHIVVILSRHCKLCALVNDLSVVLRRVRNCLCIIIIIIKLFSREIIFEVFQPMWSQCQTDRRHTVA